MLARGDRRGITALALLGVALLSAAGTSLAAGGAPSKATEVIGGRETFKPNAYLNLGFHFIQGTVVIRSGGTVTLTNTTKDPHTLSIVKKSQVPRTIAGLENCEVCGEIAKAHGLSTEGPPHGGPPPNLVVNVGAAGFNQPGDSVVIGPKGSRGSKLTFKVTAPRGTVLNFICAIHPWMQGRFIVK